MWLLSRRRALIVPLLVALVGCTAAPPSSTPSATPTAEATGDIDPPSSAPAAPTAVPEPPDTPAATASATSAPPATPPGVDITPQPAADLPAAHVFARAKVGSLPSSMASAGGKLWLADGFGLAELDPGTGAVIRRLEFGPLASLAAVPDGDTLVAASYSDETVAIVDPATGSVSSQTEVPCPQGLAPTSRREVWVTSPCVGSVARVTIGGGVEEAVDVTRLGAIAVGGGAVWVVGDGNVVRIDPATLDKRQVFPPALGFPSDIAYVASETGAGALWVSSAVEVFVTSSTRGSMARIDPEGFQAESIDVGSRALLRPIDSIDVHDGHVWAVGVDPNGNWFEVPRVLTGVDTGRGTVVDELVIPPGSSVLSSGSESDTLWLAAPMDQVIGVRAVEGTDELPAPTVSEVPGLAVQTTPFARDLPDHVYLPAEQSGLPTFVLVGGGPVPPSEVHHMSGLATALAARGAVVHVIGYRSEATGDGIDETYADIRCAVAYARSAVTEFGGDARVALVGFSYGGEAVVTAATSDGPANPDCAASGASAPDAVVALDGFPRESGGAGRDVPMLFVGARGGNYLGGQQLASAMQDEGYAIETVELAVDHGTVIDPSPTVGVVERIVDFAGELGP